MCAWSVLFPSVGEPLPHVGRSWGLFLLVFDVVPSAHPRTNAHTHTGTHAHTQGHIHSAHTPTHGYTQFPPSLPSLTFPPHVLSLPLPFLLFMLPFLLLQMSAFNVLLDPPLLKLRKPFF